MPPSVFAQDKREFASGIKFIVDPIKAEQIRRWCPHHALSGGDRHDKFGVRHDGSGGVGRSVTIGVSGCDASPR